MCKSYRVTTQSLAIGPQALRKRHSILETLDVLSINAATDAFVNHLVLCRRRVACHLNAVVVAVIVLAVFPNASVDCPFGYI